MKRELPDCKRSSGELVEGQLTGKIIECFFAVYNTLGFGMLESVYRNALVVELSRQGAHARQEVPIEVLYQGVQVGFFRLDVLVEDRIAVEIKATDLLSPVAQRQLLNYLRASHLDVGLLLHFGPEAKFYRLVSSRVLSRRRKEQIRPLPEHPWDPLLPLSLSALMASTQRRHSLFRQTTERQP